MESNHLEINKVLKPKTLNEISISIKKEIDMVCDLTQIDKSIIEFLYKHGFKFNGIWQAYNGNEYFSFHHVYFYKTIRITNDMCLYINDIENLLYGKHFTPIDY